VKNYTFVDYATQAYIALVGLLILFFHNDTVSSWPLRVGAHAALLLVVHGLIQLHARYAKVGLPHAETVAQLGATHGTSPPALSPSEGERVGVRGPTSTEGPLGAEAMPTDHDFSGTYPSPCPLPATRGEGGRRPGEGSAKGTQGFQGTAGLKLLDFLRHFYPVLLYTAFFIETGSLNRMFFRDYLDPLVAQWEQDVFGCQPSVLFMEKLPSLVISELFYISYFSYYIMISGVGIALFLRSRQQFFHYVSVVSFLFYACYFIYIFLPVIGSRAFFRQVDGYALPPATQQLAITDAYPEAVQAGVFFQIMKWVYRVFEAPGAAFPSSHVAVALCTVFFSFRYLRRIRYLHLAVAIMLCLSTIYCRYHYVVDVLAGLVTAAILIPTGNWLYFKFQTRDTGQLPH